jgi:hypothetical protein
MTGSARPRSGYEDCGGDGIPADLLEGPTGEPPPPPLDTAAQTLPFASLSWPDFERLCLRLASVDGEPQRVRRFGVAGQGQEGIDIYSRLNDQSYATYQCKRRETISDKDLVEAVERFRAGEWAGKAGRFVFCTSKELVRTELVGEIEAQTDRLRESGISFEVWDSESLSLRLKAHPGIVEDFFGAVWLERFSRPETVKELRDQDAVRASDAVVQEAAIRLITIDWAPGRIQTELAAMQKAEEQLFILLTAAIGAPPNPISIDELLADRPDWLLNSNAGLWALVARISEDAGAWSAARQAWEGAAERSEDKAPFFLMAGAAAAGIEDDEESQSRLIDRARAIDPDDPRVRLGAFEDSGPAAERLARLEGLRSDDPEVRSLIFAHRVIAALQLPDLDLAREYLVQLKTDAPGSVLAGAADVNLVVQSARLDVIANRPIDISALRRTRDDALNLRDRLLKRRRFEESARLLMMAADSSAMMGERERAADLLRGADPAELMSASGPEVLAGAAAGRALDYRLGLQLIAQAPESSGKRLIEAECLEEVGSADQRRWALATLEGIVEEDNDNSPEAAFVRLAATLGGRETPWSEKSAAYLREHSHVKAAVITEAMYQARWHSDYEKAEALLAPHLDEVWGQATRLRLAIRRGRRGPMKEAADAVMSLGPSQQLRLDAGRAYLKSGHLDRAREVLLGVARDPGGPPAIRSEAYRFLLMVVGTEQEDWRSAAELHREWVALDPGSPGANAWAPTIANRSSRHRMSS